MSKIIKKTINILSVVVASIVLLLASIGILLKINKIQNAVAGVVVRELSDILHTKVSLGHVDYKFFNVVHLDDLYIQDLEKDTLLNVESINAGFSFWRLFKGEVVFSSVSIDELEFNLKSDSRGKTNVDFILKALARKKKKEASVVWYEIKNINIQDSKFTFTKEGAKWKKGVFNPKALRFVDLNTVIDLNLLNKDSLSVDVKALKLKELSGLNLEKLAVSLNASKSKAVFSNLSLQFLHSKLSFDPVEFRYDSLPSLKNFSQKVKWKFPLQKSTIQLSDFGFLIPQLARKNTKVTLQGQLSGRHSSIKLHDLKLSCEDALFLNADLDLNGLPNIEETFVYAQIHSLKADPKKAQDLMASFVRRPIVLPKELSRLGIVRYDGNITGFLGDLVAYGNLNTAIGSVSTDISLKFYNELKDLKYSGMLRSANLRLGQLTNTKTLGKLAFEINTVGQKMSGKPIKGKVNAVIDEFALNQYIYKDILFEGDYEGKGFKGKAQLDDENIHAEFNGQFDFAHELPVFDFDLGVDKANLNALRLTDKYSGALFSFNAKTNLLGNSLDNLNGSVLVNDIQFINKGKILDVNHLLFVSNIQGSNTRFIVDSEYLKASFEGAFKYSTIASTVKQVLSQYLPALNKEYVSNKTVVDNQMKFNVEVSNPDTIASVLEFPYRMSGFSRFSGEIDGRKNLIEVRGVVPSFRFKKFYFEDISLKMVSDNKEISLFTQGQVQEKGGFVGFDFKAAASNDSLRTLLSWKNNQKSVNRGQVIAVTTLKKDKESLCALMNFQPSEIVLSDEVWNVQSSTINFNQDSTIDVHEFKIENNNQSFKVDGRISKKEEDVLSVELNKMDLDYILRLVKLRGISIGGAVSGNVDLKSLFHQPIFLAELDVQNVMLNQKRISDAKVTSTWDGEKKQVLIGAHFINQNIDTVALAKGFYIPKTDSIDIIFDMRKMPVYFLDRYFQSVAQNVTGFGKGNLRMFGTFKTIGFEGDLFIDNAKATIGMLKTSYFFSDSIHLRRKTIGFRYVKVFDEEGNSGILNGYINHDGLFSKMKYSVNVKAKNILGLNTQAKDNDYFFGKVYGSGTINIFGDDKECNINVNAVAQPKSKCYIQMGGASSASDNSFVSFVNTKNVQVVDVPKVTKSSFNVRVDLQVQVRPDSEMDLLVDPKGGDVITGRGNGNLRVQFDSFSPIKLYGTYDIDYGYYLFTLQTVIRKEFQVQKGSTITWTGDPFGAKVDIQAIYPLSASLTDLLDDAGSTTSRGNVPVNCVLKLTDDLMKPTIKFDIDLPQSDEGVKQKVKSIINTDEMMNRQIAYLLLIGKFYALQKNTELNPSSNNNLDASLSFATSTLSSHLNNWVQKSIGSNNLSIGVDWQKSQYNNDEVKAEVNYQPNKRIILNGNIGYRNEDLQTNNTTNSKLIGDFDFEYLLTESGKLRFKGYSRTVDRSQLKEAKRTQGLGFGYKEDFDSVNEMFKYYWSLLNNKQKETSTPKDESDYE